MLTVGRARGNAVPHRSAAVGWSVALAFQKPRRRHAAWDRAQRTMSPGFTRSTTISALCGISGIHFSLQSSSRSPRSRTPRA